MMVKLSAEHYNLEKVAEVLSISAAEVNRLREQGKLRGFRDGSTWKFLKEEVHTYLAESIKSRSGTNDAHKPGESDFDLGGDASSSSFDILMEDAALPDDSDLVSVAPARPSSDLDLAALDNDELSLAEETQISSLVVPKKVKPKETAAPEEPASVIFQEDEDSSALTLAKADDDALEDEASVLEAGGSSPQLGLAGDSGFDVLVAGDDEDILHVDDQHDIGNLHDDKDASAPIVDEFDLEPSPKVPGDDDSESSSQVISIDITEMGQVAGAGSFGQQDDDFDPFSGFDSGIHQTPQAAASSDPFGTDAFAAPSVSVSPPKAAKPTEEYSTGILVALAAAVVVMVPTGWMLIDNMTHMWSWGEPFILNSIWMDAITGLFGL